MSVKPTIGRAAAKSMLSAVDGLFDRLKARVLGGAYAPKQLTFKIKPPLTLPGLFQAAGAAEAHKPDEQLLDPVLEIAAGYLDAQRARTKAKILHTVQSSLDEAHTQGVKTDWETVLDGQLSDVFGEAKNHVKRIVATEANHAKTLGGLDAIIHVNAMNNIEDPVIYWICIHDDALCQACKRLHLLGNGKTPRAWYLSEVKHDYGKPGDDVPSMADQHPNGRCQIASILPGYGFDEDGNLTYKGRDYSEIDRQRGRIEEQPEVSA